ncbi:MAG: DNA recombination protein RmuC [Devosia sp.]|uniref:DNA recombination protein RmuC n=1 Tax=Devosia sp. 66-22 TaxID=1895753 RepID=UPI000929EBFD|nr:DNA recombination protein RmuC [Devosia sp. 66-22]MBN9348109.1 DNA recombination protein RmuC [Devosia sp.]OJX55244.1 MAG: DNA recombinase [Devosia sp. 66-22]
MDKVLFSLGEFPVTLEAAIYAIVTLVTGLLVILVVMSIRAGRERAAEAEMRAAELEAARAKSADLEGKLAGMLQGQYEMNARMQTMAQIFGDRTSDLMRSVNERIDAQGQRVGQALQESNTKTTESLGALNERLAVIDKAQSNMADLGKEVVSLQSILSNKQTRGAFGQGRMEAIITDHLPAGAFAFQYTLSNNKRPDCVVFMPNGGPKLVVDAKFPLESWERVRTAQNEVELKQAMAGFRTDIGYHVRTISENYLIPDETQDTAFMFVPSESIFADIHERFDDLVQKAMRQRVVIVSPLMLMLAIQVVQGLLRDVRMREEAHKIQKEVRELLDDVGRLKDRVIALQKHFAQANNDIGEILTSTSKVVRRGQRIDELDLDEPAPAVAAPVIPERKVSGGLF